MRFITGILFIFFFIIPNFANAGYGSGQLNISGQALNGFINYIQNPGGNKRPGVSPMKFSVSTDGQFGWYYYCMSRNANRCGSLSDTKLNKQCEIKTKSDKCEVFAVRRSIKWRNGVAENKKIKFKSSDSREEIIAKLTDLGFIKNQKTTKKKRKKKLKRKEICQIN